MSKKSFKVQVAVNSARARYNKKNAPLEVESIINRVEWKKRGSGSCAAVLTHDNKHAYICYRTGSEYQRDILAPTESELIGGNLNDLPRKFMKINPGY